MSTNLAERLKQLISEKHTTASALERKAGLKENTIWNILHGKSKRPRIDTIKAIATALDCSVAYLIEDYSSPDEITLPAMPLITQKSTTQFINSNLFLDVSKTVVKILDEQNIKVSLKQFLFLIEQVYLFSDSKDTDDKKADKNFIEWILAYNFNK